MASLTAHATAQEALAFLTGPHALPPEERPVRVQETRTSFVVLTPHWVYKLKKPVRDEWLDFTTPQARRANALAETSLNARLAPDVYRGVVALTREADGGLRLDGAGEAVDWLVFMRRLPEEGFLDVALAAGRVDRAGVARIAAMLARFYAALPPEPLDPAGRLAGVRRQIWDARAILLHPKFRQSHSRVRRITGRLLAAATARGVLGRHAAHHALVEGHGDLRPEHVWLNGTPAAIDGLEFARPLRLVDPFDELVFLGLECERLDARWIGPMLLEAAEQALGQRPGPDLLAFYRAFRATLRASLALRHYLEPPRRAPARWKAQARAYLAIAEAATGGPGRR